MILRLVKEPFCRRLLVLLLLLLEKRQECAEDEASFLEDDGHGNHFRNAFACQHENRMHM